jgi:hypothetical protein
VCKWETVGGFQRLFNRLPKAISCSNHAVESMARLVVVLAIVAGACHSRNPASPLDNRNPIITSLAVFPSVIGRNDSAVVICGATDPDGDPIVYDWETDGRLQIQGAPHFDNSLYDTHEPTRVFYPASVDSPVDTAWIDCSVRDHRGGMATATIHLVIRQP